MADAAATDAAEGLTGRPSRLDPIRDAVNEATADEPLTEPEQFEPNDLADYELDPNEYGEYEDEGTSIRSMPSATLSAKAAEWRALAQGVGGE